MLQKSINGELSIINNNDDNSYGLTGAQRNKETDSAIMIQFGLILKSLMIGNAGRFLFELEKLLKGGIKT